MVENKLRVLFMGSGEFAVPILAELANMSEVDLVGIVTQPDKLAGRGNQIRSTPVKDLAIVLQKQVYQPSSLKTEAMEIVEHSKPELIVVAAYGQFVPDKMLYYPKFGAINLHASLLPDLRGAVPIPLSILRGYTNTGVTIQKMVKEMDAGDVLMQENISISSDETTETLSRKLSMIGAQMLRKLIPRIVSDSIVSTPQDSSKATYCYQTDIAKERAEISFATPVVVAERMVRAFYPWPVAWFDYGLQGESKRVRIFKSKILDQQQHQSLRLVRRGKSLVLELKDGSLELLEVQLESKKRLNAQEYLYLANS